MVAQFTCEGTNDGPFASLKPTGRKMSLPFCEICHFDKQGRIVSGGCYYDQYTLLTQLGHIQPLAVAATPAVRCRQETEENNPSGAFDQDRRSCQDSGGERARSRLRAVRGARGHRWLCGRRLDSSRTRSSRKQRSQGRPSLNRKIAMTRNRWR